MKQIEQIQTDKGVKISSNPLNLLNPRSIGGRFGFLMNHGKIPPICGK